MTRLFTAAAAFLAACLLMPAAARAAPSAPAMLTATPGPGVVTLAWASSSGASGYHVWRRPTAGGTWVNIDDTGATVRTLTDTTGTVGTSYTYAVRAYDATGVSASSPFAVATALPVTAPGGSVLWTADGSLPLEQEWAEYSTAQNCAVDSTGRTDTRFTQEAGVYRAHVVDGDACYGERAEVGQDLPSRVGFSESRWFLVGREYYVAFQIRLGAGFPVNATSWQVVAQWKQLLGGTACCPLMAMQVHGGRFWFENAGGTHAGLDMGAATTGAWHRFTVRFLVSASPSVGYVEAWHNDALVTPRTFMQTTAVTAAGVPLAVSARIGVYRNPAINQSGGSDAYYDGYTVASTRAAAEANAYAP